jgi:hypothetical protein
MVSNWIERKVEDAILLPIPYADREVIEVAEGILGVEIAGLPHIDLSEMSTSHKALLAIFGFFGLPAEALDLIGMDPFRKDEADYHVDEDEMELDSPSFDATTGRNPNRDTGRDINRGRREGEGEDDSLRYFGLTAAGLLGMIAVLPLAAGLGYSAAGIVGGILAAASVIVLAGIAKVLGLKAFGAIMGVLFLLIGSAMVFGGGSGSGMWGIGFLLDDTFGAATAGFGDDFEDVSFQAGKVWKGVTCLTDRSRGAGCVREWQLEQTRRPGSEDVGETYELRVNGPQIYGGQNGVDIAYQTKDAPIPVYFLLENMRHGIKGITAEDVQYRVSVRDEQIASSGTVLCSTANKPGANENGWMPLDKYGDETPSGVDSNDLLPGEAVEPLNYRNDNQLTLEECGLLQPSAGSTVSFVLELKYDYSSQSTLQIPAMSRSHRRSQGINIRQERSETADTPVETFIQARSPVLFQDIEGQRTPLPFQVRLGVNTDEDNIEYRVDPEAFELQDSSATTHLSDSCSGLAELGENTYALSGSTRSTIVSTQQDDWYDSQFGPSARCTFQLEEPIDISPTGETLTMNADVSYTVKQDKSRESFKVSNSLCAEYNCPMLVPLKLSDIDSQIATNLLNEELMPGDEGYWDKRYAKCGRPQDADKGCSVIESFDLEDRNNGPATDLVVENGDIAVEMGSGVSGGNNLITCYAQDSAPTGVVSIRERGLKNAWEDANRAFNYTQNEWRITRLRNTDPKPDQGCSTPSEEGVSDGSGERDQSSTTLGASGEAPTADLSVSPPTEYWTDAEESEDVRCYDSNEGYDGNGGTCTVNVEFTAQSSESISANYRIVADINNEDFQDDPNPFSRRCTDSTECSVTKTHNVDVSDIDSYSANVELQERVCRDSATNIDQGSCRWESTGQSRQWGNLDF